MHKHEWRPKDGRDRVGKAGHVDIGDWIGGTQLDCELFEAQMASGFASFGMRPSTSALL